MQLVSGDKELEMLNQELNNAELLQAYKKPYDSYEPLLLPKILGGLLVFGGNLVYGYRPSYLKFRSIEVIARVPYHSWESAAYTLLTAFYANEIKAMELSRVANYSRIAHDNETMHVVVISHLAKSEQKAGLIRHSFIPMLFAFFYFWASYFLFLLRPRWSYELNFLFEQHAFEQYSIFLETHAEKLQKKKADSEFLVWYGRHPRNQYEFFRSVRNDEIIHRNHSIREVDLVADKKRVHFLETILICFLSAFAISAIYSWSMYHPIP